jgi:hypothetical protein
MKLNPRADLNRSQTERGSHISVIEESMGANMCSLLMTESVPLSVLVSIMSWSPDLSTTSRSSLSLRLDLRLEHGV